METCYLFLPKQGMDVILGIKLSFTGVLLLLILIKRKNEFFHVCV